MFNILFFGNSTCNTLLIPEKTSIKDIYAFIMQLETLIYKKELVKWPLLDISFASSPRFMDLRIGLHGSSELNEDEADVRPILGFIWDDKYLFGNYCMFEMLPPYNCKKEDIILIENIIECVREICCDNILSESDFEAILDCKEYIEEVWADTDWNE